MQGVVDGHAVVVGRERFLADWVAAPRRRPARRTRRAPKPPAAPRSSSAGTAPSEDCSSSPTPSRTTSAEAIAGLQGARAPPRAAHRRQRTRRRAVAAEVGIDEVIAEVLPADKVDVVRRLQAEGTGRRDGRRRRQRRRRPRRRPTSASPWAPAPTSPSRHRDLTLVRGDLRAAVDAIRLSRRTLGTIKGNLFWAFAYNVAALPLAAAGLLNPMLAGAAMAFSSVFVVTNSLRLRRFRSVATDGSRP